ncbi:MAG: hypothetical protein GWM98_22170 [Nitrospinaceae bacterium]|nr:hypothetical protein [Nitrospinaceae bacterium]NIR56664.1 hypothetical protein [Nitrospinaceae bacterium]NIS87127.1 hypothetical protein [Nitrospinaceae bacterium]NIT83981.1 hypothetical protein [Nitrospinaceae bacterium]NIU46171.1 hypothetical protein [Nitrospinaceae bacterium]
MKSMVRSFLMGMGLLWMWAAPALAYVGPGAGVSVISSLVGVVVAVFVALGAILAWPVRRFLKKRKQQEAEEQ